MTNNALTVVLSVNEILKGATLAADEAVLTPVNTVNVDGCRLYEFDDADGNEHVISDDKHGILACAYADGESVLIKDARTVDQAISALRVFLARN